MLIAETIKDEFDDITREVIIDTDAKHLYVKMILSDGYELVRLDDKFESLSKLSAFLDNELHFKASCELLERNNVPHDSPLWDLNHSNPWRN